MAHSLVGVCVPPMDTSVRPRQDLSAFRKLSSCNLPTDHGQVKLTVYGQPGQQDWVVCSSGIVCGKERVHTRVHDACLTSEVLGSLKCDCAAQLRFFREHIAKHGGVLIYTPQEGRGIGLANKIKAYALQEQGLDTVDANTALGLPEEARNYQAVPLILRDLGVRSVVLLTNNPFKLSSLRSLGVVVERTSTIIPEGLPEQCQFYLRTKAGRMGHILPDHARVEQASPPTQRHPPLVVAQQQQAECSDCDSAEASGPLQKLATGTPAAFGTTATYAELLRTIQREMAAVAATPACGPYVTLTYAQTLDGSIAGPLGASGPRLMLSGARSMAMTHSLRALHDAIVVGIGTVLGDDPQLTVRLVDGSNPLRVVLDGSLRISASAKMMKKEPGRQLAAVVVTRHKTLCSAGAASRAASLRAVGVRVLAVPQVRVNWVENYWALMSCEGSGVRDVMG